MSPPTTRLRWLGTSVTGPRHLHEERPNEDAWLAGRGAQGTYAVVSDGMGSRPNARAGARGACRAVRDALRHCPPGSPPSPEQFLRLVHALWNVRIAPATGNDSAATCLFAAEGPSGKLWLGQLGDGLVVVREPDGRVETLGGEREGFSNETTGLGLARATTEWRLRQREALAPGAAVLLASDGVAEDLQPERLGEFIRHVMDEYGSRERARGRAALSRVLKHWPTPGHADDKTLVLLWHEPEGKSRGGG